MSSQIKKYSMNLEFQDKILSLILNDPKFLPEYSEVIDPRYFEQDYAITIAHLSLEYYNKYLQKPTKDVLITQISEYCDKLNVDYRHKLMLLTKLDNIMNIDIAEEADFIKDKIIDFGKKQHLKQAVIKMIDLLEQEGDYDEARSIVDRALSIGASKDIGVEFFENAVNIDRLYKDDNFFDLTKKVSTGFPTIDKSLYGGVSVGELLVIVAPPNIGKSAMLVNLGVSALSQGKTVYHYTFELHESDVLMRYAMRFSGLNQYDIIGGSVHYKDRMRHYIATKDNQKLWVKYFPPATVTVGKLRSHITRVYTQSGSSPNVIIIDYADEMLASGGSNAYEASGILYKELIKLGYDFGTQVYTASQSNREGAALAAESGLITMENAADSYKKAMAADIMITMNQNQEDKELGLVRLYLAKVRRGESRKVIDCIFDPQRMTIKEYAKNKDRDKE